MSVQRFASVIRLRPEKESEYRELHSAAWPEVLRAIARAGIRNYSIFLRDGLLFSYLEYVGDDYAGDTAKLSEDEATRRWWLLTDPCQSPIDTAAPGEWWAPADEVFHTDGTDPVDGGDTA
jgi:L-rhamnose mutarotase